MHEYIKFSQHYLADSLSGELKKDNQRPNSRRINEKNANHGDKKMEILFNCPGIIKMFFIFFIFSKKI